MNNSELSVDENIDKIYEKLWRGGENV